jgi:hypothetical protein
VVDDVGNFVLPRAHGPRQAIESLDALLARRHGRTPISALHALERALYLDRVRARFFGSSLCYVRALHLCHVVLRADFAAFVPPGLGPGEEGKGLKWALLRQRPTDR